MMADVVADYSRRSSMSLNGAPNVADRIYEVPDLPPRPRAPVSIHYELRDGERLLADTANKERQERQGGGGKFPEGSERWLLLDYLAVELPRHSVFDWCVSLLQMHSSSGTGSPPFSVQTMGDSWRLFARSPWGDLTTWPIRDGADSAWEQLLLGVGVGSSPATGWLELWLNGAKVGRWAAKTSDGGGIYYKEGDYRLASIDGVAIVVVHAPVWYDRDPYADGTIPLPDGTSPPPVPVPTPIDTEGPTVVISAPADNVTVEGPLVVTGTAADESGVASVSAYLTGQDGVRHNIWTELNPPYGDSPAFDTSRLPDGPYAVEMIARDALGNERGADVRHIMLANQPAPAPPPTTDPCASIRSDLEEAQAQYSTEAAAHRVTIASLARAYEQVNQLATDLAAIADTNAAKDLQLSAYRAAELAMRGDLVRARGRLEAVISHSPYASDARHDSVIQSAIGAIDRGLGRLLP